MGQLVLDLLGQLGVGLLESFGLEDWVPSEISAAAWFNNGSWGLANKELRFLQIWAHKGDNAHGITCFVWEWLNHLGQSLWTYALKEPFDVGSWESFVGIEAERCILDQDWFFGLFECNHGLVSCNFQGLPLQFGH